MKGTQIGVEARRRRSRVGVGAAAVALTLAAGTSSASAGEIEVTTKAADGRGSLAAAVKKANKREGADSIRFARGLRGKIDLPEEVTTLTGKVVIAGDGYGTPGAGSFGRLVLSGHRGGSVLEVGRDGRAALRELYLDGVALQARRSDLTVQGSFVEGERTVDETGIEASGGELRVLETTVTNFDRGIAIGSEGRIDGSTISGNVGGGGVAVSGGAFADISNSTISGNVVSGSPIVTGGGLGMRYGATARLVNTTVAGNEAVGNQSRGGGVFGDVEIINSTIAGNRAASGAGVAGDLSGDTDVANSIVFGNLSFASEPADCQDPFTSGGGNVIGAPGECVLDPRDVSANPMLGPLRDNGGLTETMAIGPGSPAIGLAVEATASKFDQRGIRRGSDPDSGAYERRG